MTDIRTYTPEEVAAALTRNRGYVRRTATDLGCTIATVYNHIRKHEVVSTALRDIREEMVDRAEQSLDRLVDEDNFGAVKFVLEKFGGERGYAPQLNVTLNPSDAVKPDLPEDADLYDLLRRPAATGTNDSGVAGEPDDL